LLYSYRKWGRDLSVAIPASCGLAFLAWGIWGALQSLAITGYISPLFAAIAIHIIFSIAGIVLLIKNDR
ncbi:MAG: LptF/LptG family permease, partial [Desulforhopalus sp.]